MIIVNSKKNNVNDILNIISQAKEYLKNNNIDQWQDGYPNDEAILKDISKNESFVVLDCDEVVGTFAMSFQGEKNYDNIYEGEWKSNKNFVVVHRVAISNEFKGKNIAGIMIDFIKKEALKENIHSIKIDTHTKNNSMRKFLEKSKFEYCGIIYTSPDKIKGKRVAYELLF